MMWHATFATLIEQASTVAGRVDALFLFLLGVSLVFTVGIFVCVVVFSIKYRRRSQQRPKPPETNTPLEVTWTVIPLLLTFVMFAWGTELYVEILRPPTDAREILVVGKQWMWKLQQPEGKREINELHVPVGRDIRLTLTSEDVIHSFFVPAFRVKRDAVPGRYTTASFRPTIPGRYHLFCTQYCGTQHAGMIGSVIVMEPEEFERWLSGGGSNEPPVVAGRRMFREYACDTCHQAGSSQRGPPLEDLYGSMVRLNTGEMVKADESYLRESILNPSAKIASGYQPLMPTYQGLINEEGVMQIIAYLKSLSQPQPASERGGRP